MISIETEIKWNLRSFVVSFYAYILHTQCDIEASDIYFVEMQGNNLYRWVIADCDDCSFYEMLSKACREDFSLSDMKDGGVSMLFYEGKINTTPEIKKKFSVYINRISRDLYIDFYNSFNYEQQRNFASFYIRILSYAVEHGECLLKNYSILKPNEITSILSANREQCKEYKPSRLVIEDFWRTLSETPSRDCIVFKDEVFSYTDIERQSNQLANLLHQNGMTFGGCVAIYLNRSEKILSSILAVMKCGGYYIPIDISTPVGRVNQIVEDCNPCILLSDDCEVTEKINPPTKVLQVSSCDKFKDSLVFTYIRPSLDDVCYMIYTSGTTGKPKGIRIFNRNVANFVSNNAFDIEVQKKIAQKEITIPTIVSVNKVGFDAFMGDMLLSVACCYKIVMASSEDLENSHLFVNLIKRHKANIIQTTPTRLSISVLNYSPESLKRFKVIACGGEPLINDMVMNIQRWAPKAILINVYGPTETTIWSTSANITKGEKGIGKPAQNTRCYILNRFHRLMPHYEKGIIHIGGDGLGEYLSKDFANKFFIFNENNELIYNTGDTAFWDKDYNIIYGERVDTQVKINGVRIELEELESIIQKDSRVQSCVVTVKEIPHLGRRLVLYYVSDYNISYDDFRELLQDLPNAYVPNFYEHIHSLPLTSSGKVDRRALPMPQRVEDEMVLPRNQVEQLIYNACKIVKPEINLGIDSKLSYYGFTSIDMVGIVSEMEARGLVCENYRIINNEYSIAQIASQLEQQNCKVEVNYKFPSVAFESYNDKSKIRKFLLTGASGFLGVHVLSELLQKEDVKIVCLAHNKDIVTIYKEYGGLAPFDESRVSIIYGDLAKVNLGLSDEDLELAEHVDAIINCAAMVKYYGSSEQFHRTNVLSVKNLIKFAIENKLPLNHISTLSVLGMQHNRNITERDFWVGQKEIFSNQYVESKFLAENEILKWAKEGLNYRIIRVGRLSWRTRDGGFQKNKTDNEFYSLLYTFIKLGKVPSDILDINIEISPVEFCAKVIVNLCNQNLIDGVFHVQNENLIKIGKVIGYLSNLGCRIEPVSNDSFLKDLNKIAADDSVSQIVKMCCVRNKRLVVEHCDFITNDLTKSVIGEAIANPQLDESYFSHLISLVNE